MILIIKIIKLIEIFINILHNNNSYVYYIMVNLYIMGVDNHNEIKVIVGK